MGKSSQKSDDLKRYGRRLSDYLLALEQITKMLEADRKVFIGVEDIRLQDLFLNLYPAFNSQGAFIADENGMILKATPDRLGLKGKKIPMTVQVKSLLERGEPLIAYDDAGDIPELEALSVSSLLMVRLETPWGKWLVGVCNGQNAPGPYLGEDQKFFDQMNKMLSYIAQISVDKSDYSFTSDRYYWARLRGEWDYLSRASEDFIHTKIPMQQKAVRYHDDFSQTPPDVLLSDHLDAELSRVMRTTSKTDMSQGSGQKIEELIHLVQGESKSGNIPKYFRMRLHNGSETSELEFGQYPQTSLAIARVCMYSAYLASGFKIPSAPGNSELTPQVQDNDDWGLSLIGPSERFWTVPNILLGNLVPTENGIKNAHSEWQVDWARTQWQRIYYLAFDSLIEPKKIKDETLDQMYNQAWHLTASILTTYLESQLSGQELSVDSDWLILWLTNNVLLSKRISDYYGLVSMNDEVEEGAQRVSSPAVKMRYIAYLCQLVLYALHCIRHAWRRAEIKDQNHRDNYIRPPFADVPVGISPSLSEAQLYILSEYAYREIGVNRELCIFERLARQLYYELPLYASGSFYRDHLYHVIDVCLLGELLLRSLQPGEKKQSVAGIVAICVKSEPEEELLENWYVAALCHDLGYIVEQADGLLKPVGEMNGKGLTEFFDEVKRGLGNGEEKLRKEFLVALDSKDKTSSIIEDLENIGATDHGIVGWLHLLHWLRNARKDPITYKHALSAILRHNLPDQTVDIREEPLTFLLMLCDHLQEWGRPRVGPDPLARGIMEALRFSEHAELETKIRVRQLKISGLGTISSRKNDGRSEICKGCIQGSNCVGGCLRLRTRIKRKGLRFELAYLDAIEGDFDPGISWFLLSRNLQCFSNQQLPYPISIVLKHNPSRIWYMLPGQPLEMDLLQDFANADKNVSYLCEWIEAARKHQKGIAYDTKDGYETFTITVNELEFPLRRGIYDDHWKDFRKWKWQRLSRQYMMANLGGWWPE